jgi:hypothetical protein
MSRLVLTRPHVHAGKTYAAGAVLDVDADIAEWLLANGIAVPEPKPTRGDAETSLVQRKEPKS